MIKTGNITHCQYINKPWANDHGTFHPHFIKLDNGDEGTINTKEINPAKIAVGKELWYSITLSELGNKIKGEKAPQNAQPQNTNNGGSKSPEVQLMIIKQSSLKCALDYTVAFGTNQSNVTPEKITELADYFVNWVLKS